MRLVYSILVFIVTFSEANAQQIRVDSIPYQYGWPVSTGSIIWDNPCFADVDSDGDMEVVCLSCDDTMYVWNHDGTRLANWPQPIEYPKGSPAVGDIDGDGDMEIVTTFAIFDTDVFGVYAWHHDGTLVDGFPAMTGAEPMRGPSLADLDGDGRLEIACGCIDSTIHVFRCDGTPFPGWPQYTHGRVFCVPAIGDVDGDGDLEIVAVSDRPDNKVYCWHHDGSLLDGWPVSAAVSMSCAGPVLADFDEDGKLEVVVGTAAASDNVWMWHSNGEVANGWPRSTGSSVYGAPAIGDIDGDGELEVVVSGMGWFVDYHVHAWNYDGSTVSGWPGITSYGEWVHGSAAIGDIDGDGDMEVIVGSDDHKVYAFHDDATWVDGFPLTGPTGQLSTEGITIGDLDLDGDIEIAVSCLDHKIYVWDCPGLYDPTRVEWPTFKHDNWRTGWYHPVAPKGVSACHTESTVSLTWKKNPEPDIAGYGIYRGTISSGPYVKVNTALVSDTTYADSTLPNGTYYYVVTATIRAGKESKYSEETEVTVVGVEEDEQSGPFRIFGLAQNCPNPFTEFTEIRYTISSETEIVLAIYDPEGRLVKELARGTRRPGAFRVKWDGRSDEGVKVSSGVYFCSLITNESRATRKMVLLE